MSKKKVSCVDRERDFRLDELFFSTTDSRGVITYGNSVFTRVSGFEESELVGFAHSKVRHPDMPQSVFRLFWDIIGAGETVAAYVKNRAKDGEYYWVLAVAAPVASGYLSVRLKPTSPLFDVVKKLYAAIRAVEYQAENDGLDKEAQIKKGAELLFAELKELGYENYESFMWHALATELTNRKSLLKNENRNRRSKSTADNCVDPTIAELSEANHLCDKQLSDMLDHLATFRDANDNLYAASLSMLKRSDSISTLALNATISAGQSSENTATLVTVAESLSDVTRETQGIIAAMCDEITNLIAVLQQLSFGVSVATLQGEISSHFLNEIGSNEVSDLEQSRKFLLILMEQSTERIRMAFERIETASVSFRKLEATIASLVRNARAIRFVRIAGAKEAAITGDSEQFIHLFDEVRGHIQSTLDNCTILNENVAVSQKSLKALTLSQHKMSDALAMIEAGLNLLRTTEQSGEVREQKQQGQELAFA